jgi:methylenetetrahydrofolate dehydrogenase (NADP+)/methenyltetrahydrofolate cyclohydrolase
MAATIIDGHAVAQRMETEVRQQVREFAAKGIQLKLAAVLVGGSPASLVYARSQARQCEQIGIAYELVQLPGDSDTKAAIAEIERLNNDPSVTGIMLHMPLPPEMNASALQYCIDPYKDVEGVNPANIGFVFYGTPIIAPCTALAVVELVNETKMELRGAHAVVVGQGAIVGRPVTIFLIQRKATVTACASSTVDLIDCTRRADLLVVGVGRPGLITARHVKPGAVVIDVGINRIKVPGPDGKSISQTVGDVDFNSVSEVAGAITPVPGGVGPVTVTVLLRNTVEAARKQQAKGK